MGQLVVFPGYAFSAARHANSRGAEPLPPDALAPARGIVLGVVLSAAFWLALGMVLRIAT